MPAAAPAGGPGLVPMPYMGSGMPPLGAGMATGIGVPGSHGLADAYSPPPHMGNHDDPRAGLPQMPSGHMMAPPLAYEPLGGSPVAPLSCAAAGGNGALYDTVTPSVAMPPQSGRQGEKDGRGGGRRKGKNKGSSGGGGGGG